ncbi:hypothetical protein LUZ60_014271 [Juncus effusus]|nr:hypothetical protein LUZ60_014271 [Juncus effusus]
MCSQHTEETADHLFLHCEFALLIWRRKGIDSDLSTNMSDFWREHRLDRDKKYRDAWGTEWLSTYWNIWKARNRLIFRQTRLTQHLILAEIAQQNTNWENFC